MRLIVLLAATGLGLAMFGIYGVIAYFVAERTSEIGLRLALGAERGTVLRMVLGHGLRMALAGVSIGLLAALPLTRMMTTLLYDVKPTDARTFFWVAVVLVVTGLVASWVPAWKAARRSAGRAPARVSGATAALRARRRSPVDCAAPKCRPV
jgi:ABC-type antimicrobial peptide transport system permease subunit